MFIVFIVNFSFIFSFFKKILIEKFLSNFVDYIERGLGMKFSMQGTGPSDIDIIVYKEPGFVKFKNHFLLPDEKMEHMFVY